MHTEIWQPTAESLWQLILASLVIFGGGWPIVKRSLDSIVQRSLNIFTLIGMGTFLAYGFSVYPYFFPHTYPAIYKNPLGP